MSADRTSEGTLTHRVDPGGALVGWFPDDMRAPAEEQ